jgi:hypothetical protein
MQQPCVMVKALRAHCAVARGVVIGDIIPETHLVAPGEAADVAERANLRAAAPGEAWICKPTTGAGGRGIHIAATAADAIAHIDASASEETKGAAADDKEKDEKKPAAPAAAATAAPAAAPAGLKPWQRGPVKARSAPAWLVQRYLVGGCTS